MNDMKDLSAMTIYELVEHASDITEKLDIATHHVNTTAMMACVARLQATLAEARRRDAAPTMERVPDGLYATKHGDGLIGVTTKTNQLSVSEKKRNMRIWVGTLPDGWELWRPATKAKGEVEK